MNTKSISDKLMSKGTSKKTKDRSRYSVVINCLMGSIITVMVILVFTFIQMMFKSGADGRRETFFGALYFDAQTLTNGNTQIDMGLANGVPILGAIVVMALIYYAMFIVIKKNISRNKEI